MTAQVFGIDVSKWQGDVNFKATMRAGMCFAFVKCTEGHGYRDPMFEKNWQKLVELDGEYIRGAYHFARPDSVGGYEDGQIEAEDFCNALINCGGHGPGCLPPVLDFEKYTENTTEKDIDYIRGFRERVNQRLKRDIMVYTGKNAWKHITNNWGGASDCPLWIAQAKDMFAGASVDMGALPWESWKFWQFSMGKGEDYDLRYWLKHKGEIPGIPAGWCDVNVFNGSKNELWKIAGLQEEEETEPEYRIYKWQLDDICSANRKLAGRASVIYQIVSAIRDCSGSIEKLIEEVRDQKTE